MDIHLKGEADGMATARALKQAVQLPDVLSLFTPPGNNQGVIRIPFHECERGLLELAVEDNGLGLSSEFALRPRD
jgi:hypothetical protein